MSARRAVLVLACAAVVPAAVGGCVRRTLSITSEPTGALVWINDREIGRTPVDTEFLYYGMYDVRLVLDGYEPLQTTGEAEAPWWDLAGPDFVAEVLPVELHREIAWHYRLEPSLADPDALTERARDMRSLVDDPEDAGQAMPAPEEAVEDEPGG